MSQNRGKQFEDVVRKSFEKIKDVSVIRLHDQTNGYLGSKNICDFIVYKYPYQYCIECKCTHSDRLPFSNITENQWNGLLEQSKKYGVIAGVLCWWIERDKTRFLPIVALDYLRECKGFKSIPYTYSYVELGDSWAENYQIVNLSEIEGKKKRVFFDYDMSSFFPF